MALYYDAGHIVGAHHRKGGWYEGQPPKKCWWSTGSKRSLFGIHLWDGFGYDVYLCEGETDAMALYQTLTECAIAEKFLVLALAGGMSPALWESYSTTIKQVLGDGSTLTLCFDPDEAGETYLRQAQSYFLPDVTARKLIIPNGHKDVCEWISAASPTWEDFKFSPLPEIPPWLLTGTSVLSSWEGKTLRPPALTTGFTQLDELVDGYRPGTFIMLAAGEKQGKSALSYELALQYLENHGKVLFIPLEMSASDSLEILGASVMGVNHHDASEETIREGAAKLADRIYLIDQFGELKRSRLGEMLDLAPSLGVGLVVLDHITAASTSIEGGLQTAELDSMLYLLKGKLNERKLACLCVTHVNVSGNELVTSGVLRGSRGLGHVPTCVLGVRRIEDGLSEVYTITVDRSVGKTGRFFLDYKDGRFTEVHKKGGKYL